MEEVNENNPKWSMLVWFSFTEEIVDDNNDIVGFKEIVGLHTLGFNTQSDATKFKDKIWTKGYPLNDNIGRDWARVFRVRIVNNQLAREFIKNKEEE